MRFLEKSQNADESSTINHLPDEIILQVLSKLTDLKTLCFCYLVSRRFSSIVLEVGAISFTVSSLSPRIADKNTRIPDKNTVGDGDGRSWHYGESFLSATMFLSKFKGVKSLCIELPSSSQRAIDNHCLFKWEVKFDHRIESFIFLAATSICDKDGSYLNGNGFEDEDSQQLISDTLKQTFSTSCKCCLKDVVVLHRMLLHFVKDVPMLEEVSITDSWKSGRLSLSGEKLSEMKGWVNSASEFEMDNVKLPDVASFGFIPVLKLTVSGYVMKRIFIALVEKKDFQGGYDFLKKIENGVEDKGEAVYTEAMVEILEKHRGVLLSYPLV